MNEPQQMLGPMSQELLGIRSKSESEFRVDLLERLVIEKMLLNKTLKNALQACCTELAYLIEQTETRKDGSVWTAYVNGIKVLSEQRDKRS